MVNIQKSHFIFLVQAAIEISHFGLLLVDGAEFNINLGQKSASHKKLMLKSAPSGNNSLLCGISMFFFSSFSFGTWNTFNHLYHV